jgi:hypothetical protein
MVTTTHLIPIQTIARDPPELVHLTGSFQVVARVTLGGAADRPAHIEVCLDAARVRGVGLKTGAWYEARGTYRCSDDLPEVPAPVDRVSAFELLRHGSGEPPSACLLLVVRFQVTVQSTGRVLAGLEAPRLLPCPDGSDSVPETPGEAHAP